MYAVPVPHEIAAPSSTDSSSGRGTIMYGRTVMYGAWPPSYMPPYTFASVGHIW